MREYICQYTRSQSAGLFNSIKILIKFKHRPWSRAWSMQIVIRVCCGTARSQSRRMYWPILVADLWFAIIDTRGRAHAHAHSRAGLCVSTVRLIPGKIHFDPRIISRYIGRTPAFHFPLGKSGENVVDKQVGNGIKGIGGSAERRTSGPGRKRVCIV